MSVIEISSMMNDVDINISQLRILLRILRHEIGANWFESESDMSDLCDESIIQQFEEYKYIHDIGSKLELLYIGFETPL